MCLSVSTCIQYYFKGFSLKTVSTPNQKAGWKRETFCLPITLPTTCLRAASFPKHPGHLAFLSPAAVSPLPISSPTTVCPWLSESQHVLCVLCDFGETQTWIQILPPLAAGQSLNFSAPHSTGMGICPSLNGCD